MPEGGKRGLCDAIAREKAAEISGLAAEAARSLGCGDASPETAGAVISAGMLQAGCGMLGKLLAAIDGTGVPVTASKTAGRDGKGQDDRARTLEFMLGDREDEWLAARPEDLEHGDIDGICQTARACPPPASRKTSWTRPLGYFENNAPRMRYHWFRSRGLTRTLCGNLAGRLSRAGRTVLCARGVR